MPLEFLSSLDPDTLTNALIGLVLFLVVYFALLVFALTEMIRLDVSGVVIAFTYLSLIPFPLFLILGIFNLIIWFIIRKDMMKVRAIRG